MLFDLLNLLPQSNHDGLLALAMIGATVGGVLWIVGVKFSRPLITLLTVLLGAVVGLRLPHWFNWSISGAGPAVGGAVILGVSGFVLHRMWVGIMLGLVLATWAIFAIWLTMHGNQTWTWPAWDETSTACSYAKSIWASVPPNMARLIPFATGTAIVSGLASCILWPRFTTALNWSAVGVTMLIGFGMIALSRSTHSNLLSRAPQKTWAQLATVGGMLLIGFIIQMKLAPDKVQKAKIEPSKPDEIQ